MKKLAIISSAITYFIAATVASAQINVSPPAQGYKDLGEFIGNIVQIAFGIGLIVTLIYLIWGAFDWITSGGDKEAVGKARGKIINALIGIAVLAVAFALANVAAQILGWDDIYSLPIPSPKPR